MKQTTCIADGKTKIFHFAFPFFLKSDVIIEVDSQPATNYNLICIKNGLNADIPFSGGQVHFNKPPKLASVITIRRVLPLTRIVDYQPTEKYNPATHNQDMNYIIEILKDMRAEIDSVTVLPTDASNKNAIDAISEQVSEIASALDEIRNSPTEPSQPVDLSEINSAIDSLTNSINTLNTRCNQIDNAIENLPATSLPDDADYVVDSQLPTAENNYTWYRKYASGWIEQGGIILNGNGAEHTIELPITMQDNRYTYNDSFLGITNFLTSAWQIKDTPNVLTQKTPSSFSRYMPQNASEIHWIVQGMAAE